MGTNAKKATVSVLYCVPCFVSTSKEKKKIKVNKIWATNPTRLLELS